MGQIYKKDSKVGCFLALFRIKEQNNKIVIGFLLGRYGLLSYICT